MTDTEKIQILRQFIEDNVGMLDTRSDGRTRYQTPGCGCCGDIDVMTPEEEEAMFS